MKVRIFDGRLCKQLSTLAAVILIASVTNFAQAATSTVQKLTVVDISTPAQPGYSVFWSSNLGHISLERSSDGTTFSKITDTDLNYYLDFSVESSKTYTYRIGGQTATITNQDAGKPTISDIKLNPGTSTADEASIIVTFKTDKLATAQVSYGETKDYSQKTDLAKALNQSHTFLVEKLKPNTTYHVKVTVTDSSGKNTTESDDQTVTTNPASQNSNIFQSILQALESAFSGFGKWFSH